MKNHFYFEAKYNRIIRPLKPRKGHTYDKWVTVDSPKWQRDPIVQIRRYQSLECDDGINWDTSNDGWKDVHVYTFTDFICGLKGEDIECLIGAAGFEKHENPSHQKTVILNFCWLHPFWRNKGLLKHSWPDFVNAFGQLYISEPISNAMRGFLKSQNWHDI